MDMGNQDKFELEKKADDSLDYQSPNLTSDWRYGGVSMPNSSIESVHMDNPIAACKGGDLVGSPPCSSLPLMDSFCPASWNNPAHTLNLGFSDNTNSTSTSNVFGLRGNPGAFRMGALEVGWNSMLKGGLFMPDASGMLPHSLSQLPTDSGFIQRAARLSCFSGGNFTDLVGPFSAQESLLPCVRNEMVVQGHEKVSAGNGSKSGGESQMNELNITDGSKDVSKPNEQRPAEGSPLNDGRGTESFLRSFDEAKQGVGVSGDESDEAEFSGSAPPVDSLVREPSTGRGSGSKKRKRTGQTTEQNQAEKAFHQADELAKAEGENQLKGGQTATNKTTGKNGKPGPQDSDPPKEEYIHVRARRGQATNSHSLAERVRREKISERMKFLQDLVPGCSKVTGKAVMLDEIINYVQSLQRQVEFLSMKLATVNPRMDFSVENLLQKDMLQAGAGPSSVWFSSDLRMSFPQLHPSQPGLLQVGLPVMANSSDVYRQSMNAQLATLGAGFKEPTQLPNAWDEGIHNVVRMGFDRTTSQDLEGSQPSSDHMKAEL